MALDCQVGLGCRKGRHGRGGYCNERGHDVMAVRAKLHAKQPCAHLADVVTVWCVCVCVCVFVRVRVRVCVCTMAG